MSEIDPLYGGFAFDVSLTVLLFSIGASGIAVLLLRRRNSKRALDLCLRGLRSDFAQISMKTQTKDIVVSQNGRKYFGRSVSFFDVSSICIAISGGGWAAASACLVVPCFWGGECYRNENLSYCRGSSPKLWA